MNTKLLFWDSGDASCGIASNSTSVELNLEGASQEETADNIAHAKAVLSKAFEEIWDGGPVTAVTEAEAKAF